MYAQNFFAAAHVRPVNNHAPVKAAGPEERWVKNVRPVGCSHKDNAFVRFEAIHLDQQLVQGLLALVVSATEASPTVTAHRIDFINEDDAGRVLLSLFEQVANTGSTHADKHFNEVGTRNREKGNVGFACNRSRQKGLTGSRWTDEQHAFRNAPAKLLELLRLAQELDDFAQFFFRFIHAGNVFKRHLLLLHGEQAGPA